MNNQTRTLGLIAERIDAEGDCWEWIGAKTRKGYGSLTIDGRTYQAHRLVWSQLVGPIKDGHTLDHLCRNRPCVKPDHLEPVTMQENYRRSYATQSAKAKARTHCSVGHELTPENTITRGENGRRCRICTRRRQNAWQRAKRQRKKQGGTFE